MLKFYDKAVFQIGTGPYDLPADVADELKHSQCNLCYFLSEHEGEEIINFLDYQYRYTKFPIFFLKIFDCGCHSHEIEWKHMQFMFKKVLDKLPKGTLVEDPHLVKEWLSKKLPKLSSGTRFKIYDLLIPESEYFDSLVFEEKFHVIFNNRKKEDPKEIFRFVELNLADNIKIHAATDCQDEYCLTCKLTETMESYLRDFAREHLEKKKRKDISFNELFKKNQTKIDSFFKLLTQLYVIDKDRNWVYEGPKSSLVACFKALLDLDIICQIPATTLQRVVQQQIHFTASPKLFHNPYRDSDYLYFHDKFINFLI